MTRNQIFELIKNNEKKISQVYIHPQNCKTYDLEIKDIMLLGHNNYECEFYDIVSNGVYHFIIIYPLRSRMYWRLCFYVAPIFCGNLIFIEPNKKFYEIRGQTIFELKTVCEAL